MAALKTDPQRLGLVEHRPGDGRTFERVVYGRPEDQDRLIAEALADMRAEAAKTARKGKASQ